MKAGCHGWCPRVRTPSTSPDGARGRRAFICFARTGAERRCRTFATGADGPIFGRFRQARCPAVQHDTFRPISERRSEPRGRVAGDSPLHYRGAFGTMPEKSLSIELLSSVVVEDTDRGWRAHRLPAEKNLHRSLHARRGIKIFLRDGHRSYHHGPFNTVLPPPPLCRRKSPHCTLPWTSAPAPHFFSLRLPLSFRFFPCSLRLHLFSTLRGFLVLYPLGALLFPVTFFTFI